MLFVIIIKISIIWNKKNDNIHYDFNRYPYNKVTGCNEGFR